MTISTIRELFSNNIDRRIEEVIKVDQADEEIIRDELAEYVVTDSIRKHFTTIFEHYQDTHNKPNDNIAVWVSGFFGSGKSSFAKYLGLALENRDIKGKGAAKIFGEQTGDAKIQALLNGISAQIPTESVIFDVSTDRGIRTGNQTITEIMYRLFLHSLGYAKDLDLSELEITLEEDGRLDAFKGKYEEVFKRNWDKDKGKIAIAVQKASRVMHELEPETYASPDSWRQSAMKRADITPGDLAKRGIELMARRSPGKNLVFVIDEVGQFVARDVQKMLDLQAVVQNLGRVGRGKMWIIVTSQEKLTELASGLDDNRVELARLMDRFPLQVHLEPADISEVTSKRVLSKNAEAEKELRDRFGKARGRLTENTKLTADIKLPELSTTNFVDLYPLLPYQIDLIIQVVSGLRTQGGASKHVGGANRTIIKLAQQLLVHPDIDLAGKQIGELARIDQVYDLVSGNIGSEVRGKIDDIGKAVEHPLAQPVAKAICLLQFVRSIHRTAENIAATLHPAIDADSRLAEVKVALQALEAAHMVRQGDDGYRIPSPAEDDWETQRSKMQPKAGDVNRLHAEVVTELWKPQPQHSLHDVKSFKAGLFLSERPVMDGAIPFHLMLAQVGTDRDERVAEARKRSQNETKAVFWVAALDDAIDKETVELFRCKEMISKKGRGAQTADEGALVSEERRRQRRHQEELRRLLKQSLLTGTILFRGNDRSPDDTATDVTRTASKVLSQALPEVFDRFEEAAAKVNNKDIDALMTQENLRGLPAVFSNLSLVRDQGGQPAFAVDGGPLAEVMASIVNKVSYGEPANGRYLSDHFGKEPYGWDFDIVRLLVVALMRAGKLEATSNGQVIESALSLDARTTFSKNNLFRQASFRPRTTECEFTDYVDAAEAFKVCFGREITELEEASIAGEIRTAGDKCEGGLRKTSGLLRECALPGQEILDDAVSQIVSFRSQRNCQALKAFTACHLELKEAIKRNSELEQTLTEPCLLDLKRASNALGSTWDFLDSEEDLDESIREQAAKLKDTLAKETFFRELPTIDTTSRALEAEFKNRHKAAVDTRVAVYEAAREKLKGTPGWDKLDDDQKQRIAKPLTSRADADTAQGTAIPLLRSETRACDQHLQDAVREMHRLVDGNRIVQVTASGYFSGGIETEEQLEQALAGLKDECLELIGAGKKVLVQ